jgi:hypothetical protein
MGTVSRNPGRMDMSIVQIICQTLLDMLVRATLKQIVFAFLGARSA